MKVIKSLENRRILIKGTFRKIASQKGAFLNFFTPLMTAGLPLMKNVLTPLAESVLLFIRINSSSNRWSYSKENVWIRYNSINNFK